MTAPTIETGTAVGTTAASGRAVQAAISAAAMRDAVQLWKILDPQRIDATFPGWLAAMRLLIQRYYPQSSLAAAATYKALRASATGASVPTGLIKSAPLPGDEWLRQAFGFAGPGQLLRDQTKPNTALTVTLGTTSRIVQHGGRLTTLTTVEHDPVALGWYRIADGHPCAFCALLASRPVLKGRGSLYKSEETAGFKAHNHCACSAVPMFDRDQELPDVNQQAAEVYRNRGDGPALPAFRKAWAEHQNGPAAA